MKSKTTGAVHDVILSHSSEVIEQRRHTKHLMWLMFYVSCKSVTFSHVFEFQRVVELFIGVTPVQGIYYTNRYLMCHWGLFTLVHKSSCRLSDTLQILIQHWNIRDTHFKYTMCLYP